MILSENRHHPLIHNNPYAANKLVIMSSMKYWYQIRKFIGFGISLPISPLRYVISQYLLEDESRERIRLFFIAGKRGRKCKFGMNYKDVSNFAVFQE